MTDEELVPFDSAQDMDSILRVWRETNWWDGEDRQEKYVRMFFESNDSKTVVGRLNGQAEALAHRTLSTMQYGQRTISAGAVTAVTTSRIARRRRLASRLTARATAHLGDEGCAVAMLGMFEQGFYDRFGYGVGPYENDVWLHPASLRIPSEYRTPERIDVSEQLEEVHAAVVARMPQHGMLIVGGEQSTETGLLMDWEPFVYGYRTDGAISHFIAVAPNGEHGPDRIFAMAYQTPQQCLELLRLVQEWGDQIDVVRFTEPAWMQVQDFMAQPGRDYRRTKEATNSARTEADAWWQLRILDIDACVKAMPPTEDPFSVVVELTDPITEHLVDSGYDGGWEPLPGLWRLEFGAAHGATRVTGTRADLSASVNALSRWWLGVLPGRTLAAIGQFDGDADLIRRMDELTAHLPPAQPGWNF